MKKYIALFIGAIILFVALNVNLSVKTSSNDKMLSSLSLANIEALAIREVISNSRSCYRTISMKGDGNATHQTYCGSCDAELAKEWSNDSSCSHNHPL